LHVKKADAARQLVTAGVDPSDERKDKKATQAQQLVRERRAAAGLPEHDWHIPPKCSSSGSWCNDNGLP